MARGLDGFELTADELEWVMSGLKTMASGEKPVVEMNDYMRKIYDLRSKRATAKAAKEKEKGAAYAEKAATEEGAVKMASGLVMIPMTEGTGDSPAATDKVKVHYKGTLIDGTEFDSSYKRNAPAQFPLNGVIKCWTEGVQKMKVGGQGQARLSLRHRLRGPRPTLQHPWWSDLGFRGRTVGDHESVRRCQPPRACRV